MSTLRCSIPHPMPSHLVQSHFNSTTVLHPSKSVLLVFVFFFLLLWLLEFVLVLIRHHTRNEKRSNCIVHLPCSLKSDQSLGPTILTLALLHKIDRQILSDYSLSQETHHLSSQNSISDKSRQPGQSTCNWVANYQQIFVFAADLTLNIILPNIW